MIPTPTFVAWKVHCASPADRIHRLLATDEGRASFWAGSAREVAPGEIDFRFPSGDVWRGTILRNEPPRVFSCTYSGGSVVTFELAPASPSGTIVTCTNDAIPPEEFLLNHAGWVSVLLNLKAVADHGIDLRQGGPHRTWEEGFVDV